MARMGAADASCGVAVATRGREVSGLKGLDRFNRLSDEEATRELLAGCHPRRRAAQVAADEHRRITRLRLERLVDA